MMMRVLLLATALARLAPIAARAGEIIVTGYDLPDGNAYGTGLIDGYSYYDGPVTLHVQGGPDITAYCADLTHVLQGWVGYSYGLLTQNGHGNPISQALSNRIGHIAELGFAALSADDGFKASAAQFAIWSLEYDVTPTFYNGVVQSDFQTLIGDVFANNGSYARALIPDGAGRKTVSAQQMVVGLDFRRPRAVDLGDDADRPRRAWLRGVPASSKREFVALSGVTSVCLGAREAVPPQASRVSMPPVPAPLPLGRGTGGRRSCEQR